MTGKLITGYRRFRSGYFQRNRKRLEELALGQAPEVAMVSCCDARVDPTILFDVEPGEIFVIRNVANLVPPFETEGQYHGTSAALEFAVTSLKVKQIVVLGHANCGGIQALMENDASVKSSGFVDSWMRIAAPAREEVLTRSDLDTPELRAVACEKAAVQHSLRNLMSYPWVRSQVRNGDLNLIAWYYDLRSGEIAHLEEIDSSTLSIE